MLCLNPPMRTRETKGKRKIKARRADMSKQLSFTPTDEQRAALEAYADEQDCAISEAIGDAVDEYFFEDEGEEGDDSDQED